MVVKYSGIAGKRGYAPKKIVLHNDEGSQNANSAFYKRWLETHNPEVGYAHYYVADDGTYQAEKDENCAWHCGNTVGNRDYIGIEICQSKGNEATFKANEQRAFKLAYDLCKKYGIAITVDNFPLHKELSATSCPRRSLELHGKSNSALKKYIVEQVLKFGGATAKPTAKPVAKTKPKLLSATAIRDEVIAGKWGSGQDRINRLTKAGYDAKKVQADVNKKLLGNTSKPKPKKTNQEVAKEIALGFGGWGNGQIRINKLKAAGYDPVVIQNLVNKMFK